MKKILFSLLLVAASFFAAAQDTVRYPDPCYAYTDRGVLVDDQHRYSTWCHPSSYYYSDYNDTLYLATIFPIVNRNHEWLYGVAVTLIDSVPWGHCVTNYTSIYFNIYHGVTITPTNGLNFDYWWSSTSHDTLHASRQNIKQCMFEYDFPVSPSTYAHCYEYYFDQPVSVAAEDTIYIGLVLIGSWNIVHGYDSTCQQKIYELDCRPVLTRLYGKYDHSFWGGVFPIVELRCTAPRGFHMCDTGVPTACWSGDTNAVLFQLSVCSSPKEPELGTLATTHDTSYTLSGLHPDSAYLVYLRKMCTFISADTVWSDWSGPLVIGDTTGWSPNSIVGATTQDITLTPNPTSDKVTVESPGGMRQLTVFNSAGVQVHSEACGGKTSATIDLRGWPAGQYVVSVETAAGTVSKVLTVAR